MDELQIPEEGEPLLTFRVGVDFRVGARDAMEARALVERTLAGALPAALHVDLGAVGPHLADRHLEVGVGRIGAHPQVDRTRPDHDGVGFQRRGDEAEAGALDLLAIGPAGAMLIDHKSGGGGDGFGPYWPQLSSYAGLLAGLYPQHPLQGVAVFWVDHGWLELADEGASAGACAQARVN